MPHYSNENSAAFASPYGTFVSKLFERGRSLAAGYWAAVPFDVGNFVGNGTMSWGVAAENQVTLAYTLVGKSCTLAFNIANTNIIGPVDRKLRIRFPAGLAPATSIISTCVVNDAGAGQAAGVVRATAGGQVLDIEKINTSDWTATASNNTWVMGVLTYEIT